LAGSDDQELGDRKQHSLDGALRQSNIIAESCSRPCSCCELAAPKYLVSNVDIDIAQPVHLRKIVRTEKRLVAPFDFAEMPSAIPK